MKMMSKKLKTLDYFPSEVYEQAVTVSVEVQICEKTISEAQYDIVSLEDLIEQLESKYGRGRLLSIPSEDMVLGMKLRYWSYPYMEFIFFPYVDGNIPNPHGKLIKESSESPSDDDLYDDYEEDFDEWNEHSEFLDKISNNETFNSETGEKLIDKSNDDNLKENNVNFQKEVHQSEDISKNIQEKTKFTEEKLYLLNNVMSDDENCNNDNEEEKQTEPLPKKKKYNDDNIEDLVTKKRLKVSILSSKKNKTDFLTTDSISEKFIDEIPINRRKKKLKEPVKNTSISSSSFKHNLEVLHTDNKTKSNNTSMSSSGIGFDVHVSADDTDQKLTENCASQNDKSCEEARSDLDYSKLEQELARIVGETVEWESSTVQDDDYEEDSVNSSAGNENTQLKDLHYNVEITTPSICSLAVDKEECDSNLPHQDATQNVSDSIESNINFAENSCSYCNKQFETSEELNCHLKYHKKNEIQKQLQP